jgi:hypothetical protein
LTIREHIGAGLVAAAAIAAALAQGLFEPGAYAAASIVVWAVVLGGLVSTRLPLTAVSRPAAVAGICLAAMAVLATGSMAWAADQGRAFEEAVRVWFYLGLFVLAVCTASRRGRSEWVAGLTVGLGIIAIIALLAYLQPGLLGSEDSDVPNAVGRLSYPLGYWNGAGALLAIAAVLLSYGGARAPSKDLRSAAVAVIPLVLLATWLAHSRGALAALLIGWCILVAASPDRARQLKGIAIGLIGGLILIGVAKQMDALTSGTIDSTSRADGDLLSALGVLVAAITGAAAWVADEWTPRIRISRTIAFAAAGVALIAVVIGLIAVNPVDRFNEFRAAPSTDTGLPVGAAELSSNGRWQFWTAALDAFEAEPVRGVGAGGYENWWATNASVSLFARNPHSLLLQQGAEYGIAGLLLFAGFVVAVGLAARRVLSAGRRGDAGILTAVAVTGAVGATVDWTWEIPAVFGPAIVCCALLAASAPSTRPPRAVPWIGFGAVIAAWIGMVAAGVVMLTHIELDRSRDAAAAGDVPTAIDRARAARAIQPWAAEPYTQLALLEAQRGDIPRALDYLKGAETRDENDWRLFAIEATLHQRTGDGAAVAADLERAQAVSPVAVGSVLGAR